jgi:predicted phage terminase large subunit-like protein
VAVTHQTDKIRRIARLAPLAEQGRILWPSAGSKCWSADVPRAQEQFEQLGQASSQHDDGADAVEMAIGLLRGVGHKRGRARLIRRAA